VFKTKKYLVCVITSEATWNVLETYCFNDNFKSCRDYFDLAVVLNGRDSSALKYITQLKPEYLFQRPNRGLDLAAFDYAIKNIPLYDYYIFLHDDHWFVDNNWFISLKDLISSDKADVFGNLVKYNIHLPKNYDAICKTLGFEKYIPNHYPFFLQGLAGIYKGSVIKYLLEQDGIPHVHTNSKEVGCVCERVHSFILLDKGFRFEQIPPGYELYLKHRDWDASGIISKNPPLRKKLKRKLKYLLK
jgi:hypothetical protein